MFFLVEVAELPGFGRGLDPSLAFPISSLRRSSINFSLKLEPEMEEAAEPVVELEAEEERVFEVGPDPGRAPDPELWGCSLGLFRRGSALLTLVSGGVRVAGRGGRMMDGFEVSESFGCLVTPGTRGPLAGLLVGGCKADNQYPSL